MTPAPRIVSLQELRSLSLGHSFAIRLRWSDGSEAFYDPENATAAPHDEARSWLYAARDRLLRGE